MFGAGDVRALSNPQLRHDAVFVARAAVEALVAFGRGVDFGDGGLADGAAEDELLDGKVIVACPRGG